MCYYFSKLKFLLNFFDKTFGHFSRFQIFCRATTFFSGTMFDFQHLFQQLKMHCSWLIERTSSMIDEIAPETMHIVKEVD